ncbi:hypothetical protein BDQ12DRAFT_300976 [Crucibulum laeve]|uniref:Uncharacterized protein n=1 Tax=Crucibulum laeve TaxID=68775 RepID=A0A5C3MDX0_9AGAR|nr:hypothetical protein BDQ12DRAFT_300976 [Crucibulum laeve]
MSSRGDHRRRDRSWERDDKDRGARYSRGGRGGRGGGSHRDEPRRRSSRSRSPRRDDRDRRGYGVLLTFCTHIYILAYVSMNVIADRRDHRRDDDRGDKGRRDDRRRDDRRDRDYPRDDRREPPRRDDTRDSASRDVPASREPDVRDGASKADSFQQHRAGKQSLLNNAGSLLNTELHRFNNTCTTKLFST